MTSSKPKKYLWIFCPEMTLPDVPKIPQIGVKIFGFHPTYNWSNLTALIRWKCVWNRNFYITWLWSIKKWVIKSQNSKNRVVQPLLNQNIEMPRLIICQRNQQKYIIGFPLLIWFHLYNLNWQILSSRIHTRHTYTSYIMTLSYG